MPTNLEAHNEMKALVEKMRTDTYKAMLDKATELTNVLIKSWEDAGGCKTCNGTESVLTWFTADGGGYDEHGPCPDCTEKSKTVGVKPGVTGPARSVYGYHLSTLELAKQRFPKEMEDVCAAYGIAHSNHEALISRHLERRDYVIVTKGRKVPVGTHGVAIGFSSNAYGQKVGFVDGEGKIHWTAISNVDRCLGMDGETKRPALNEWIRNDSDFRKKKGLSAKTYNLEEMMVM